MQNTPQWKDIVMKKGLIDLKARISGKNQTTIITKVNLTSSRSTAKLKSSPKTKNEFSPKNDRNILKRKKKSENPIFSQKSDILNGQRILTPNIRAKQGLENVFYSPTGQKVFELQRKLKNVSRSPKLSPNTYQQRIDKFSVSPDHPAEMLYNKTSQITITDPSKSIFEERSFQNSKNVKSTISRNERSIDTYSKKYNKSTTPNTTKYKSHKQPIFGQYNNYISNNFPNANLNNIGSVGGNVGNENIPPGISNIQFNIPRAFVEPHVRKKRT